VIGNPGKAGSRHVLALPLALTCAIAERGVMEKIAEELANELLRRCKRYVQMSWNPLQSQSIGSAAQTFE